MMGFDGMVLRFEGPWEMRQEWMAERKFEFYWQGSANLPTNRSEIFAHVIEWNYGDICGLGLCWPGNPAVNSSNLEELAQRLVLFLQQRRSVYRGPLMGVWGSDFRFTDAASMFGNMSRIMDFINARSDEYGLHLKYATVAEYMDNLHTLGLDFPHVSGVDFEYGWLGLGSQTCGIYAHSLTAKSTNKDGHTSFRCRRTM